MSFARVEGRGKPGKREGKGDGEAEGEGQIPAGGHEPGNAKSLSPQSYDRAAFQSIGGGRGKTRALFSPVFLPFQRKGAMLISERKKGSS